MQTRSKTKQLNETANVHWDVQPQQNKPVHLAIQPQQSNHDPIYYHQQIPGDYDLFQQNRDQICLYLFTRVALLFGFLLFGLGLSTYIRPSLPWSRENDLPADWNEFGINIALFTAFSLFFTEMMIKILEPAHPTEDNQLPSDAQPTAKRSNPRTLRLAFFDESTKKPEREPKAQPQPACKM